MSSNFSKVKKFFWNAFRGNKKPEEEDEDNVRWKKIFEDRGEEIEEGKFRKPIASFPDELTGQELYVTNISVETSNVLTTRASVYVNGDDEPFKRNDQIYERLTSRIPKVNSNYKLLDMDTATITFFESDSSADDFENTSPSDSPYQIIKPEEVTFAQRDDESNSSNRDNVNNFSEIYNPCSISQVQDTVVSNLAKNREDEPLGSTNCEQIVNNWVYDEENKFESSNSLDIEKELNDLIGTLSSDIGGNQSNYPNEVQENEKLCLNRNENALEETGDEGSRINLAYDVTEPENEYHSPDGSTRNRQCQTPISNLDPYWTDQRIKSKSFAERYKLGKLLRRGKQRMSMIEFRNGQRRPRETEFNDSELNHSAAIDRYDSALVSYAKECSEVGVAYDRSSLIEPRVSSTISLAPRPHSTIDGSHLPYYSSESPTGGSNPCNDATGSCESAISINEAEDSPPSRKTSKNFNDCIDWSWLEEAMNSLNSEYNEPLEGNTSSRVDAGCQTQSDQSWQEDEERMRSRAPSPRDCDSALGANSERRILESRICNEDMPYKPFIEGSGTSGVSSWLRQSMRRVRHFNLEDFTRIRSAPPDSLRSRVESEESETTVSQNVVNNRVTTGNDVQQLSRPGNNSRSQRQIPRTRPTSVPARPASEVTVTQQQQQQQQTQQQQQQPPDNETPSSSPTNETQDNLGYESDSTDRQPLPRGRRQRNVDEDLEENEGRSPLGPWPHGLSSVFAGLGCTLGIFNISRFAILSVHFGSNFILQFLMLSLLLGVPLLAFHAALGQTLGAGPVDMWKISPLFQGIGVALLLAQALIGMYSIVGVSWMFVYFRDSFITKQDSFRWAEPFRPYRQDNIFVTSILNTSGRLEETVPDYLNVVVLQRHGLTSPENAFGHLKFQLTFNLAVIWMIVFVSLSKGLRSYGKVVYVFSVVPVLGVLIICSKLLGMTPVHRGFFPQTEWSEFFLNAKSWISAATEVMLTWNLLGVATMQVTSHNRSRKKLWRDIATITLLTLVVLILAAFLGNFCHQVISIKGYTYTPSSFERISTYSFLRRSGAPLPPSYSIPIRYMPHASLVAGDKVAKPGALHESGYQVLRLATELMPATLAILEGNYLSPFWAVLFYFTLILFGIAQQLAIWHCVITGIMAINAPTLKSWETTITFFTCAAGFILGLPMTTELGIFVVYFLDYCLGGGWWIILLTLMEICAIFMVRGRPYSGENISIALFGKRTNCVSLWAIPLLTFTWNVIMPVALLVMCIIIFKSGGYRDLWVWKCGKGDYWPLWTREVGVFVQIIPLLCIPIVGLVQCYRYLSKGPADIFDRLANLYRPAANIHGLIDEESTATTSNVPPPDSSTNSTTDLPSAEDPPPKYTPPPSYSTATGTRIAKLLRQSFRRSVRRIQTALGPDLVQPPRPPPPDYASVLVEMNHSRGVGREINPPTSSTNNFTAADVAQVLRCSFRRTTNLNEQTQTGIANNIPSQNLVIHSRPLENP